VSVLDFLFGNINDDFFGKLIFNRMSSDRYWQGKVDFFPTNSKIDIYFFDLEEKVSEEHKLFYKEFEKRYFEIKEKIIEVLKNPPSSMDYLPNKNFDKLKLIGLSFPTVEAIRKSSFHWDLYFSFSESSNLSIAMETWEIDKNEIYWGE